jgi:hypothetical protein
MDKEDIKFFIELALGTVMFLGFSISIFAIGFFLK